MLIAWAIVLLLVNAFFLVLVILGLPGNWLMVLAAVACFWWQQQSGGSSATGAPLLFGLTSLLIAAGLALAGEIAEFVAGMAGAKKAGGTWRGSLGAIIGGLVGGVAATFFVPIPIIGSLIGACIGACIGAAGGAWMFEYAAGRRHDEAVQIGVGAGVGRLMGTLIKLAFGVAIWTTLTVASFV